MKFESFLATEIRVTELVVETSVHDFENVTYFHVISSKKT
jgi:hypothetical protein